MKNIFLAFCFFVLTLPITLSATHLVGGEISYVCLGDNSYEITLTIYRDCGPSSLAAFDDPAFITIYDGDDNFVSNLSIFSPVITQLEPNADGLCLNTIPNVCIEEGVYTIVTELEPNTTGYYISYQRCCRNDNILNINTSSAVGNTYTIAIPPAIGSECMNSSPVFTNFPPIVICDDAPLIFDHSAVDADGDSLVYALCHPFAGADDLDPAPTIVDPQPYSLVEYMPGYTYLNPLGGTNSISIDPITGLLNAFPPNIGRYVIGICVSEYRDGQLLSVNVRDFQFNVADCEVVLVQANVGASDISICEGQTAMLNAEVFGAEIYVWDPAEGLSDPNILNPIVLNPVDGMVYTLIGINGSGCEDTDSVTIHVNGGGEVNAGMDTAICGNESVQLQLQAENYASLSWSPAAGLSATDIPNPIASPSSSTIYTVTVVFNDGCVGSDDVLIEKIQAPAIDAGPDKAICAGSSTNLSIDALSATIQWSPSIGLNNPNSANPIANPSSTTTYTVTAIYGEGCESQDQITVVVTDIGSAGTINGAMQYLCAGQNLNYTSAGAQIPSGATIAYYIHTMPTFNSNEIVSSSLSGNWGANPIAGLELNQNYYVTAVVAPITNNGFPDLANECISYSNTGMFVLLSPVNILINEYCDWEFTGDFTLTISATGGLPAYNSASAYSVVGTNANNISLATNSSFTIALGQFDGLTYTYTATDSNGCSDTDGHTVVCYKTPITLISFYGEEQPRGNQLFWSTGSETNHDYFGIEVSTDGIQFYEVAQVKGSYNSNHQVDYQYLDANPTSQNLFYRLKSVDYSGNYEYSYVIMIKRNLAVQNTFTIQPNPVNNYFEILNYGDYTEYSIISIDGKLITTEKIDNGRINTNNLMEGIYFIKIGNSVQKFVKN